MDSVRGTPLDLSQGPHATSSKPGSKQSGAFSHTDGDESNSDRGSVILASSKASSQHGTPLTTTPGGGNVDIEVDWMHPEFTTELAPAVKEASKQHRFPVHPKDLKLDNTTLQSRLLAARQLLKVLMKERNNDRLMGTMREHMHAKSFIFTYDEVGCQAEAETEETGIMAVAEMMDMGSMCETLDPAKVFVRALGPQFRTKDMIRVARCVFKWRLNFKNKDYDKRMLKAENRARRWYMQMACATVLLDKSRSYMMNRALKKMKRFMANSMSYSKAAKKFGMWRSNVHRHKIKQRKLQEAEQRELLLKYDSVEAMHVNEVERKMREWEEEMAALDEARGSELDAKAEEYNRLEQNVNKRTEFAMSQGKKIGILSRAFREMDLAVIRIGREPLQDRALRAMVYVWYIRARKDRSVAKAQGNLKKSFAKKLLNTLN